MAKLDELRENAVPDTSFDSQTYPITSGMMLTINHGFADPPRNIWLILKCITAEFGYAVGDEVYYPALTLATSAAATVAANATQVKIRLITLPLVTNFTDGSRNSITSTRWNLEVRLQR